MKQPKSSGIQKFTKKVHANINYTKLDEVCLDVGKVDLSYSASMRTDTGLSPQKYSDMNGHEMNHAKTNGHSVNSVKRTVKKTHKKPSNHPIRDCYVNLVGLNVKGTNVVKRNIFPAITPKVELTDLEDPDGWRGWNSQIDFLDRLEAHIVAAEDDSGKIKYTLILNEDLNENEHEARKEVHFNVNNTQVSAEPDSEDSSAEMNDDQCQMSAETSSSSGGEDEEEIHMEEFVSAVISVGDESEIMDREIDSEDVNESQKEYSLSDEFEGDFKGWTNEALESADEYNENFKDHLKKFADENDFDD